MNFYYYIPLTFMFMGASFSFFRLVRENKLVSNYFSYFGLLILFLMVAFKGDVDPDYKNYLGIFDQVPELSYLDANTLEQASSDSYGVENGILVFSALVKFFGFDYQVLIIIFAFMSFYFSILFSTFFKSEVSNFTLFCLICLVFDALFIQIRFGVSFLMVYCAFLFYLRKKYIWSFLIFILSLQMHNVAFLFPLMVIVNYFREFIYKHFFKFVLLSLLLISINSIYVLEWLLSAFPRYQFYIHTLSEGGASPTSYYNRLLIVVVFYSLLMFRERDIKTVACKLEKILFCFVIVNLALWAIVYNLPILYRITWFFDIGLIGFAMAFYRSQFVVKKLVFLFVFSAYLLFRVSNGLELYEPYTFDWYTRW